MLALDQHRRAEQVLDDGPVVGGVRPERRRLGRWRGPLRTRWGALRERPRTATNFSTRWSTLLLLHVRTPHDPTRHWRQRATDGRDRQQPAPASAGAERAESGPFPAAAERASHSRPCDRQPKRQWRPHRHAPARRSHWPTRRGGVASPFLCHRELSPAFQRALSVF